jgi:hypothetical protein
MLLTMPIYTFNKEKNSSPVVMSALEIKSVTVKSKGFHELNWVDDRFNSILVDENFIYKHGAAVGDLYVVFPSGISCTVCKSKLVNAVIEDKVVSMNFNPGEISVSPQLNPTRRL